jgi:phasin
MAHLPAVRVVGRDGRKLIMSVKPALAASKSAKRKDARKPVEVNRAETPLRKRANSQTEREDAKMEPKLEVPAEVRALAEKTIEQAEKAFGMFFTAANKSIASIPTPATEISKQALSYTEQNMKAAFDHARKLVQATDLQQAMQIQSEFLKSQFTAAGEHMRQISGEVMSAAKEATKPKA